MAQQQANIHIAAPGFGGLNTEDSPVSMDIAYASQADNCVIDKAGRISSRKGFVAYTDNPEILNGAPIEVTMGYRDGAGVAYVFACGDNKIFLQQVTVQARVLVDSVGSLVELTLPVGYTITANNWQIVDFNGVAYFVQAGHQPLKFDPAASITELVVWTEEPSSIVPGAGHPNCMSASFGHLWTGDFDGDKSSLVWSDLLDGDHYSTGSAGSLDLTKHWPAGYDTIIAIHAHNNYLIVFGEVSILVYSVPETGPVYASLVDTVEGIGCVSRDSVQSVGDDVFFLDASGVRSFGRTIQEKSMPVGDVSKNVRTDIKQQILLEDRKQIRAVYSPEESFYALFFPSNHLTYVFDTRQMLENGAYRPTRWSLKLIHCAGRGTGGTTWFGGHGGIFTYEGASDIVLDTDNGNLPVVTPVEMAYYTHPQNFGQPETLKFLKQVDVVIIGPSDSDVTLHWAFDFGITYNVKAINTGGSATRYYYNIDEYEDAQYSGANTLLTENRVNVWGQGRNVKFGFEAKVTESQLSFQELNIQATQGRIY
ncbi:MAG: hypothetical protein ACYTFX_08615 [Planctomycetota bacterium]|jgi:hypothetical protein